MNAPRPPDELEHTAPPPELQAALDQWHEERAAWRLGQTPLPAHAASPGSSPDEMIIDELREIRRLLTALLVGR